jgi:uncharacterized membrane protein (UPF0127 family)
LVAAAALVLAAAYLLLTDDVTGSEEATVRFELADGGHLNITCEVADTTLERADGLQYRDELAIESGMLFVYKRPQEATFIMHNVEFPLDIIFIAENGTVVNVEEAEVEEPGTSDADLVRYRSDGDVKWIVEINRGLSQQYGIGPGTRVEIVLSS